MYPKRWDCLLLCLHAVLAAASTQSLMQLVPDETEQQGKPRTCTTSTHFDRQARHLLVATFLSGEPNTYKYK